MVSIMVVMARPCKYHCETLGNELMSCDYEDKTCYGIIIPCYYTEFTLYK